MEIGALPGTDGINKPITCGRTTWSSRKALGSLEVASVRSRQDPSPHGGRSTGGAAVPRSWRCSLQREAHLANAVEQEGPLIKNERKRMV